jgi:hypothetical protein
MQMGGADPDVPSACGFRVICSRDAIGENAEYLEDLSV